jgi:L-aspartate oxidase
LAEPRREAEFPPHRPDLLVVGAGLAGMSAALEGAEQGASVLVASAGTGSSDLAQGGIAAAIGESDSPEQHARDTLAAGAGLCDPAAVGSLTQEAPAAVDWLAARGVAFDRDPGGRPVLALEAAHGRRRIVHAGGDDSGAAIAGAIRARLSELPGRVTWLDGVRLRDLLVDGEVVAGGHFRNGTRDHDVRAGATILATGGYAGLYQRSTTTPGCDGSGLVAGRVAGATLADLEFVQFHPTAYAGSGGTFLLTEALRGAGAHIVDGRGRRFLIDTDPRGELAPRAVVTRAIVEHLRATGRPYVHLDARHLGVRTLRDEFPGFLARCRGVGLDPERVPIPVAPAAHYTMGGIVTDCWGRTAVPGLLAAGECARTGVHGANRLASNSLLEAVVFGRRAAHAALSRPRVRGGGGPPGPVAGRTVRNMRRDTLRMDEVRSILSSAGGPLRSAPALEKASRRLERASGATAAAEVARQLAHMVLEAALVREESRGAHVRIDHPEEVERWGSSEVAVTATGFRVWKKGSGDTITPCA